MQETGFFTSFCLFLPSFEQTTDDGLILIKHFDAKKEKKVDRVVMSHIGIFFHREIFLFGDLFDYVFVDICH